MKLFDAPSVFDVLTLSSRPSVNENSKIAAMKKDLHPEYKTITITLADGSTFETRSTLSKDEYESDVDSTNHPFYTGRRQFVDTAGRVEKFNRRYGLNKDDEGEDDEEEE